MKIRVIDVSEPERKGTGNRTYQQIAVTYRDDQDKTSSKNLLSFNHPDVFKYFTSDVKKNDVISVVSQKNDKGFWEWIGVEGVSDDLRAEGNPSAPEPAARAPYTPIRSSYETAEERATKQRYIVRQSSASLSQTITPKAPLADVLAGAEIIEAWVYRPFPSAEVD